MKIRLEVYRGWSDEPHNDPDDWLELGVYPDRCRAEIMCEYHSAATRGGAYRFVKVPDAD